jgi:hypothetical protein
MARYNASLPAIQKGTGTRRCPRLGVEGAGISSFSAIAWAYFQIAAHGTACENEVVYTATGLIHLRELDSQVERAKASLGPEVMHVAYRIREDSTNAPSIFFRITLRDWATAEDTIMDVTGNISRILFDQIHPVENWGLRPYFNFRSESDQQKRPDPDWI